MPIMIVYAMETKQFTKSEIHSIKSQIQKLRPTKITTTNSVYMVSLEMKLTMVDGKIYTTHSDTPSSSTCYICRATP